MNASAMAAWYAWCGNLGAALGLAIFSAIVASRTNHLLAAHASLPEALTSGFHRALLASSIFLPRPR